MSARTSDELEGAASRGDQSAAAELFNGYRPRLERLVQFRMDSRVRGKFDPADVVQDSLLEAVNRAGEYFGQDAVSLYVWLRGLTWQRLLQMHRRYLDADKRDVRRELNIAGEHVPQSSCVSLAALLMGQLTSPTRAAVRAERQLKVQEALAGMPESLRDVLMCHYFEDMSMQEIAEFHGVSKQAVSKRHLKALRQLAAILEA